MTIKPKAHGALKLSALLLLAAQLFSCSKNNDVNPTAANASSTAAASSVTAPVNVNLLMGYKPGAPFPTRLVLPLTKTGANPVHINVVFDTGSEGLVLSAQTLIAANLISANGINLNGKDQADINGITITTQQDSASYGDSPRRTYFGQIAYAVFNIGDGSGQVTTRKMPFLLVYRGINHTTGKEVPVDNIFDGICGVFSESQSVQDVVFSRRDLRSPFAYVNYSGGVSAGFRLAAYNQFYQPNAQGATTAGNLQLRAAPLLQVGVNQASTQGFTLQQKHIGTGGQVFSPFVNGRFTVQGHSFSAEVLFDTGTPQGVSIAFPKSINGQPQRLDNQSAVSFTSAEGFNFNYQADQGAQLTRLNPVAQLQRSVIGLQFFINNAFLINYNAHVIGVSANK